MRVLAHGSLRTATIHTGVFAHGQHKDTAGEGLTTEVLAHGHHSDGKGEGLTTNTEIT